MVIFFLQLIALGIFALIGITLWNTMRGGRLGETRNTAIDRGGDQTIDGTARDVSQPGRYAAETLKEFEHAQSVLRQAYPLTFDMLGGYLNGHTINDVGGLESAVSEMIDDWQPRGSEVSRELVRLLAANETEDECRAVIMAACDAQFDQEGYRAWLMWLLRAFSEPGFHRGAQSRGEWRPDEGLDERPDTGAADAADGDDGPS